MASFIEVNKKFKQICEYYHENGGCPACSLKASCFNPPDNPEKTEEMIMNWQPDVYPTILELIHYIAADIPDGLIMPLSELVMKRIPADKAEELGLVPINEGGLTKYEDGSEWR